MKKSIILILIIQIISNLAFSQRKVSGVVLSKDDNSPLPGATIVEKGTKNTTASALDGRFSVTLLNVNSSLIISFVGFIQQEIDLKGQDSLVIRLQLDVRVDYFDYQKINIAPVSGIIHSPVGAQLEVSSPSFYKYAILKGGISYQTNFDKNHLYGIHLDMERIIAEYKFNLDLRVDIKIRSGDKSWFTNPIFSRQT